MVLMNLSCVLRLRLLSWKQTLHHWSRCVAFATLVSGQHYLDNIMHGHCIYSALVQYTGLALNSHFWGQKVSSFDMDMTGLFFDIAVSTM